MSATKRAPKCPSDFGIAGKRLWRSLHAELEFEEHELALLRGACRTADRLEALAEALEGAPLEVTNVKGDPVANPLLVEQRQQIASLARTLASLRLPTGLTEDGELIRPQRRGAARGTYGIRGAV